jgi:hypothetical protein
MTLMTLERGYRQSHLVYPDFYKAPLEHKSGLSRVTGNPSLNISMVMKKLALGYRQSCANSCNPDFYIPPQGQLSGVRAGLQEAIVMQKLGRVTGRQA